MTAPVIPERDAPMAQANEGLHIFARIVLATLAGLLLGLALTGCGGGDPDEPADQPPPALDCKARPEVCK